MGGDFEIFRRYCDHDKHEGTLSTVLFTLLFIVTLV